MKKRFAIIKAALALGLLILGPAPIPLSAPGSRMARR
jgi:hypothetical protein